ncbi:hypothetical protein [Demequina sp.]|uniref:hypothetical protein n=1 Tax=Demequina sp. TaxID=2050685 RepID=UPI0025C3AF5E|nr:hypothetical protein [Demequina sp.]
MSRSGRVALAREALPAVTAWAELVMGNDDQARRMASDAVVVAASAAGIGTVSALARAARDDMARRLAGGEFAAPVAPPADEQQPTPEAEAPSRAAASSAADVQDPAPRQPVAEREPADASSPYLPGNAQRGSNRVSHQQDAGTTRTADEAPEPDQRTPRERLADALVELRPHERLAAVRYYLDGESVDSVAALFRTGRAEAVALLEAVTAVLAPLVGEHDLPDFTVSAEELEIEVVTR